MPLKLEFHQSKFSRVQLKKSLCGVGLKRNGTKQTWQGPGLWSRPSTSHNSSFCYRGTRRVSSRGRLASCLRYCERTVPSPPAGAARTLVAAGNGKRAQGCRDGREPWRRRRGHVAARRPVVPHSDMGAHGGTPPVLAGAGSRENGPGELVLPCLCLS